jgi:hypothetical protein
VKPDRPEAKRRYARLVDSVIGKPLVAKGFAARAGRWVRGNPRREIACVVATQRSIEREGNVRFTVNWGIGGVPLHDLPTGRAFTPNIAIVGGRVGAFLESPTDQWWVVDADGVTFGDSVPLDWSPAQAVTCLRTLVEDRMAPLLASMNSAADVARYVVAMTEPERELVDFKEELAT